MTKAKKAETADTNLKAEISLIENLIVKDKKKLEKLTISYENSRKELGVAYDSLIELVDQLTKTTSFGTKKTKRLIERINAGKLRNIKLTKVRNDFLAKVEETTRYLSELTAKLMVLRENALNKIRSTDEIVTQVFALNEAVVHASAAREVCLNRHVFPLLIDSKGNLRSQITFPSSDGLKKVVAMVNTMTIIRGDLASEAKQEIQNFIDRVKQPAMADPSTEAMFEITRQLLVEKTDFKVGPNLYRFIAMELDEEFFPELAQAQLLLKQSIRSEKTNSYIRLYQRASRTENFEVVPQS